MHERYLNVVTIPYQRCDTNTANPAQIGYARADWIHNHGKECPHNLQGRSSVYIARVCRNVAYENYTAVQGISISSGRCGRGDDEFRCASGTYVECFNGPRWKQLRFRALPDDDDVPDNNNNDNDNGAVDHNDDVHNANDRAVDHDEYVLNDNDRAVDHVEYVLNDNDRAVDHNDEAR